MRHILLSRRRAAVKLLGATLAWAGGARAQQPPAWFVNRPPDSNEAWFGTGEGTDPEGARRSALRSVAARLRSAISGAVSSQVTDANGRVSRVDRVDVSEDVLKTEFTAVEVQATAKSPVGYLVLVKVDRQAFLRDTRARLEVLGKPIADAEATLAGASSLEQYITMRAVTPQLAEAVNLSLLLAGAGAEAEGRNAFVKYSGLRQRAQSLAAALVFELRAKTEDQDIAKIVAAALADRGMRSSATPSRGASVVTVETSTRQDELFGDKLLKLKVRFSVLDASGRSVASREHEVSGTSRYDFRGAREQALSKLAAAFRDGGPTAALGFRE